MIFTKNKLKVFAGTDDNAAMSACKIFTDEIKSRVYFNPEETEYSDKADIVFKTNSSFTNKDAYKIAYTDKSIEFSANGIRGLIYAIGMFLRKTEYKGGIIELISDIDGEYSPLMQIRGHQLGYRTTPNTYDAWDIDNYERYYKDIMYFGANTVEHIPTEGKDEYNRLMKYKTEELCTAASAKADEFDLDVSLWYPNSEETIDEALKNRERFFSESPRIDVVFPPGGDPGELQADDFINRVKEISHCLKSIHPNAKMYPSAQAPHSYKDWGDIFIKEMTQEPSEIDGIIIGPNRAMDIDELRMRLPSRYPIRFYPDITHNVRCEHPVHFLYDDWHYAYAATESRECVNPRPKELRLLHRLTRGYIIGSVSYSEGVNDDLNKMIWADMDWFGECNLRTSVEDYARLFFPGGNIQLITDAIFGLEENWSCDPAENSSVEATLDKWLRIGAENNKLYSNWRYIMHLFRASCDSLVRKRRIFETDLIMKSRKYLFRNEYNKAEEILRTDFSNEYKDLRKKTDEYAEMLFNMIGLQLDVKNYCGNSWERGATLETIDNNITNRAYYLNRFRNAEKLPTEEKLEYMKSIYSREDVEKDEFYYSFAEHGLECADMRQDGYVYMNFKGDNPSVNNGSLPINVLRVYDNYSFKCKISGLTGGCDYKLRIIHLSRKTDGITDYSVCFNGKCIYKGGLFGEKDIEYDKKYLSAGFESAVYIIPKEAIINGCGILELSEPETGVMFSEFSITKIRE